MTLQAIHQRRMRHEGRCVTCWQPHRSGLARCRGCQDKRNAARRAKRRALIADNRWAAVIAGVYDADGHTPAERAAQQRKGKAA